MKLTRKELLLLGRQYAEALYWHKLASPADLPALKNRSDWRNASEYDQRRIVSELATMARDELLKAGHNREQVLKLVNNAIRRW